jgi:hypothetical protein
LNSIAPAGAQGKEQMWKLTVTFGLGLALITPAMADELSDVNLQVILCLHKASLQLNDGVSDVASIAPADRKQK